MNPIRTHFQTPDTAHRGRTRLFTACILSLIILFLLLGWVSGCGDSTENADTATPSADAHVVFSSADGREAELKVEVARTSQEKAVGLMRRDKLDADSGMIFVYESPSQGGFWMKDTYIPLSIAFIAADGAIVDIQDMQPRDLSNHMPRAPYIYAVEANQGWFAGQGIKIGDRAEFLEG